jgi:hypothetical protein
MDIEFIKIKFIHNSSSYVRQTYCFGSLRGFWLSNLLPDGCNKLRAEEHRI